MYVMPLDATPSPSLLFPYQKKYQLDAI